MARLPRFVLPGQPQHVIQQKAKEGRKSRAYRESKSSSLPL